MAKNTAPLIFSSAEDAKQFASIKAQLASIEARSRATSELTKSQLKKATKRISDVENNVQESIKNTLNDAALQTAIEDYYKKLNEIYWSSIKIPVGLLVSKTNPIKTYIDQVNLIIKYINSEETFANDPNNNAKFLLDYANTVKKELTERLAIVQRLKETAKKTLFKTPVSEAFLQGAESSSPIAALVGYALRNRASSKSEKGQLGGTESTLNLEKSLLEGRSTRTPKANTKGRSTRTPKANTSGTLAPQTSGNTAPQTSGNTAPQTSGTLAPQTSGTLAPQTSGNTAPQTSSGGGGGGGSSNGIQKVSIESENLGSALPVKIITPIPLPIDAPARATGGPVSAGKPYIVGEKGPEVFVSKSSGNIIPNNATSPGTNNQQGVDTVQILQQHTQLLEKIYNDDHGLLENNKESLKLQKDQIASQSAATEEASLESTATPLQENTASATKELDPENKKGIFGSLMEKFGGVSKILGTLMSGGGMLSTAMGVLSSGLAIIAAAFVGWKIGQMIDKWTGASKVVEKLASWLSDKFGYTPKAATVPKEAQDYARKVAQERSKGSVHGKAEDWSVEEANEFNRKWNTEHAGQTASPSSASPTSTPTATKSDETEPPVSAPTSSETSNYTAPATPASGGAPEVLPEAREKKLGDIQLNSGVDISGTKTTLLDRLKNFAQGTGRKVKVNSAYRGDDKQAELWVRGNILHEAGVIRPARPKTDQTITYKGQTYTVKGSGKGSKHGEGKALDVSIAGMGPEKGEIDQELLQYGLNRPHLGGDNPDTPHIEAIGDGDSMSEGRAAITAGLTSPSNMNGGAGSPTIVMNSPTTIGGGGGNQGTPAQALIPAPIDREPSARRAVDGAWA